MDESAVEFADDGHVVNADVFEKQFGGSRAPDPVRYTVMFAADAPFSRSIIAPIAENCRVHRLP